MICILLSIWLPRISRPSHRPDEDVIYAHFDASLIPATTFKVSSNTIPTLYLGWKLIGSFRALPSALFLHELASSKRLSALRALPFIRHHLDFALLVPTFGTEETTLPRAPAACDLRGRRRPGLDTDSALRLRTHSLRQLHDARHARSPGSTPPGPSPLGSTSPNTRSSGCTTLRHHTLH
ncbi:hypothetical protein PsYK624_093620 [Phanerochaete sordida]|uniref:Uncharacterized protein n=1 Tax=Phanerochaete sordida TaxID=48140 RepID=A0A9P3GE31_9APHY|nr:hypothetical protein PsYK624_093620 [Phanerochaete sordida]